MANAGVNENAVRSILSPGITRQVERQGVTAAGNALQAINGEGKIRMAAVAKGNGNGNEINAINGNLNRRRR